MYVHKLQYIAIGRKSSLLFLHNKSYFIKLSSFRLDPARENCPPTRIQEKDNPFRKHDWPSEAGREHNSNIKY